MKKLTPIEKKALKDVQKILTQRYSDHLLVLKLFGSKARSDSQHFSNVDFLVVVEKDS